ncbi:MAG: arylsulfatase [Melioribacteraceae bacterium]|nr:arylsulfatase [Melioribacteraceae bacterium]
MMKNYFNNIRTKLYSILLLFLILFSVLFIVGCTPEESKDRSKPNIVIIVADDAGWNDVGYHGSEISTPNIDKLCESGVELNSFYTYPTCSPTRASLISGRYASRYGIGGPIARESKQVLPADVITLPKILQSNGYATAITGKWHLGLSQESGPLQYGFDYSYGFLHGQIDQYTHKYKTGAISWHRNDKFISEEGHATDLITKEAIKYITHIRDKEKPFFIYVPYSVPHYPLQEEDKWIEPYKGKIKEESRQVFAASVTHMDYAIGQLVKTLEDEGLIENTLIIFFSDNGGELRWSPTDEYEMRHGPYAKMGDNTPLRGSKKTVYEGGIRVPAFVNWSQKLEPRKTDEVVNVTDIYPTIASLAGIDISTDLNLDGENIWDVISNGAKLEERGLYIKTNRQIAYRKGRWKLVHNAPTLEDAKDELFNIYDDPNEEKDVIKEHPGIYKLFLNEIETQLKLENNLNSSIHNKMTLNN